MTDTASRHQGTAAARSALTPGLPHLVWIAPTAWDGVIGTDRPMAEQMTRYANVLWVQPQSSMVTSARRHGKLRDGIAPALSQMADRLTCLTPVALPGLTRPGVRQTTSPLLRAQIRWALRQLNIRPSAVVCGYLADVLGRWDEAVNVLYCTDDWVAGAQLMGMSATWLVAQERAALNRADVVAAVSTGLVSHWSALGAKTVLIPNGCPSVTEPAQPAPSAIGLPGPVIGLVGQLSERIDMGILTAISDAGYSLLIVGPHDSRWEPERFASLIARPNVRYIGRVPAEEVPSYLAAMDIGITPYSNSPFNQASFPMKTLEYFSGGLPVVSTDLPGSRWIQADLAGSDPAPDEIMALVSSPADMVSAVSRMVGAPGGPGPAAGQSDPKRSARCQAFATRHSWATRADTLAATIGFTSVPAS